MVYRFVACVFYLFVAWPISVAILASSTCANPPEKAIEAQPDESAKTLLGELETRGRAIYQATCAECHGGSGEGVQGMFERALTGDLSVNQLSRVISETMPEGNVGTCIGEDAEAVAAYIYQSFYSEAAQLRNRPPQLQLTRLTGDQTRQSISDIYAAFDWIPRPGDKTGLTASYFKSANQANQNKVLERIDPVVDFDFGRASPGQGIPHDDFAIHWRGGLKPDVSGRYEIVIRSTCSFVCHLGRYDRVLIDNHVQSGDLTEFRQEVFLTAGRVYPFQLSFNQRKRITELPPASISIAWVPPGGAEQVVPPSNWIPDWVPPAFALQTPLPPDDRSYGYQRGISVNRDWDDSLTGAATEFAKSVATELWPDYARKHKDSEVKGRALLAQFLRELLSTAFRHPMTDELSAVFIDKQLQVEEDDSEAIKRVVLLGLKSPRFLYPFADKHRSPSEKAATRLALTLLDSLPVDSYLQKSVQAGELVTEEQIRGMAYHLLGDYRAQVKTRTMLHSWLNIDQTKDMQKQSEQFAGFDHSLAGDLRASLDQLLDEIVWSESSDYRQFFIAQHGYTTPRIEQFYGSAWSPLEKFPVVETPDEAVEMVAQPDPLPPTENSSPESPANQPAETVQAMPTGESKIDETQDGKTAEPPPLPPVKEAIYAGLRRTDVHPDRLGVLNHPYMMSRMAYHDATSPIHRGVFLTRFMLGRVLQPPQEAFAPLSPDLHPNLTTRQRVDLQTSPENCQTCHIRINGLGYSLENWDAVGRFREMERNQPIDTSGSYVNRDGVEIQFKSAGDLAAYLVGSRDAHEAFVRRAFHHFAQQPPAAYGEDTLDRLTDRFIASNFSVRELIVEIAVTVSK